MNPLKPKRCKEKAEGCHGTFTPRNSFQSTCPNPLCGLKKAQRDRAKKEAKRGKEQRRELKDRKEKAKSRADWLKDAQTAFNIWVRKRDLQEGCISCGTTTAGQFHGGHFLTTKARPGFRYHPGNCHKQCAQCNMFHSGRISDYRPRLIEKVGQEMVDYLETSNPWSGWSIEEIKEIRDHFRELAKS